MLPWSVFLLILSCVSAVLGFIGIGNGGIFFAKVIFFILILAFVICIAVGKYKNQKT